MIGTFEPGIENLDGDATVVLEVVRLEHRGRPAVADPADDAESASEMKENGLRGIKHRPTNITLSVHRPQPNSPRDE